MKNYDPGKVVVTFNGHLLVGFNDGTFVSAERAENAFSMAVGATGDVTRVRNRNRSGSVSVTLQAASPSNDVLTTMALLDEEFGTGAGVLSVKDLNGTTLLFAESAWIRKIPNVDFAADASAREWAFDCADLRMEVGGALA